MSGAEVFNASGCKPSGSCYGLYKLAALNRYTHESGAFQLECGNDGFWKIGVGNICFYRSVTASEFPENCSWIDLVTRRPQNIVVAKVVTGSSAPSSFSYSLTAASSFVLASTAMPTTLSKSSSLLVVGSCPAQVQRSGTDPYAFANATRVARQLPATTREPFSEKLSDDMQSFTYFEHRDRRAGTEPWKDGPSGGTLKSVLKPAVTMKPGNSQTRSSSLTFQAISSRDDSKLAHFSGAPRPGTPPSMDTSGLVSTGAGASRSPPTLVAATPAAGEISAKYQQYVNRGSLSPEKAALWTREDREKVEKRELVKRLATEPATMQPKRPTADLYPAPVQSSVPRSASTDPHDRVNIPSRAPLASASVHPQPSTSNAAKLLRELSSQNLATQAPLPRPDSAASVRSEIDNILYGEEMPGPAVSPAAVIAAVGGSEFETMGTMTGLSTANVATPRFPPSTAPPIGRYTGELTATAISTGEQSDTGTFRLPAEKDPVLPRAESGDSLKSNETSSLRTFSHSDSAAELRSVRNNPSGPITTSSYHISSSSRPSALGDRSPPRSSLYPSRPSAADLTEDLARSNSGSVKRSDSSASLSRTASEAQLSPAAADRASARAAAGEDHAAFMSRMDAKMKERAMQRLQGQVAMAGQSSTAVSASVLPDSSRSKPTPISSYHWELSRPSGLAEGSPPRSSLHPNHSPLVLGAATATRDVTTNSPKQYGGLRPPAIQADSRVVTNLAAYFAPKLGDEEGAEGDKSVSARVGGEHKEPQVKPAPSSLLAGTSLNPADEDPAPSRPARKERVIEIAAAPVPAKPKKFYQLRRHRLDATAGGMEVMVPATYPGALDSDDAGRLDAINIAEESAWAESERHWSATLQALEDVLAAAVGKELPRALESQRSIVEERKTLTETVARISAAIESTSKAEAQVNRTADIMMSRNGARHTQRDGKAYGFALEFPNGEDIALEFSLLHNVFDEFAWDVVVSLEDYCDPGSNVSKLFVHSLMLPVFSGTQRYVEKALRTKQERMREIFGPNAEITKRSSDNVAWQFWLYAQQLQMPTEVSAMNDQAIRDLAAGMGPLPAQLQDILEEELRAGRVSDGLDVLKLVRLLLRLHTIALLSDPPCYLHPAPGARLPYQEGHCVEVMCPGIKKHGRIKEGDVVEVVFCGLYFQDPAAGAKPVHPMQVRRGPHFASTAEDRVGSVGLELNQSVGVNSAAGDNKQPAVDPAPLSGLREDHAHLHTPAPSSEREKVNPYEKQSEVSGHTPTVKENTDFPPEGTGPLLLPAPHDDPAPSEAAASHEGSEPHTNIKPTEPIPVRGTIQEAPPCDTGGLVPAPANSSALYFCGSYPIANINGAFVKGASGCGGAPTARLMLRGKFEREELYVVHNYNCVIKCATEAENVHPTPRSVAAIRREKEMYLEVQRLSRCDPSGCVIMYAAHPEHHYLVLEDHGTDLRALLIPSLKFQQQVLEAIVAAVHSLHSLGIMHGDIKPQNMLYKLYDHGYVIKLCDLEAAHKVGDACQASALGSKYYHAPELRAAALRGGSIKAALELDMFPLGLVMWQVLMRSRHAALDCYEDAALYGSQEKLDAHLSYRPPYRDELQKLTCLNPVQRVNISDVSKAVKNLSASSAQQGWLHEKEENAELKRAVGDQLGAISEKLEKMDAKLDRVLQELSTRIDALGSSAMEVAESLRREVVLASKQTEVLPDMIHATQDAVQSLADLWGNGVQSQQTPASISAGMQECMSAMQVSVEAAIARALTEQRAAGLAEFGVCAIQMQARVAELSSELRAHLRDQYHSKAQSARQVEILRDTSDCLKAGLTDVLHNLSAIKRELEELRDTQIQLGKHVRDVLTGNAELMALVRGLTVNTCGLPTLAVILPVVSTGWKSKFSPMRLVRDQYRLYFLCSHTHQLAPCGPDRKGKGYKITMTKQWVLDAAPVLRVGLLLVKIALLASGLPLPVPDLCSVLVGSAMHAQYLNAALHLVSNPPDGALDKSEVIMQQSLDAIHQHDASDVLNVQKLKDPGSELLLQEGSRKAYETIKEILGRDGVNIPLTCGLRQVTHRGKTAWVLDSDATERDWRSAVDSAVP